MISKGALRVLKKAHEEVVAAPTAGQTKAEGKTTKLTERVKSATSQAAFEIYVPKTCQAASFLVVIVSFYYKTGPALALMALWP